MRQFIMLVAIIVLSQWAGAQEENGIAYQTIIRDTSGNAISDSQVTIKLSILQSTLTGAEVYAETQQNTTTSTGSVSLVIGTGEVINGSFDGIDWGNDTFFLKAEVDTEGSGIFTELGTTQFLSVPYALNASSVTLTSPNGQKYRITVDNDGNLVPVPLESK